MSKLFSIRFKDSGKNCDVYIGSRWRAWLFYRLFDFEIWGPQPTYTKVKPTKGDNRE